MEEKTLIFDKWLNEGNRRLRAYRLNNQDIQFEVVDAGAGLVLLTFTLASYRAEDLRVALGRTPNPDGS
jgi:hypothetical protein